MRKGMGLSMRLGCTTVASILVVGSCHAHPPSSKKRTMMMSKSKGPDGGIAVATDSYPHDDNNYYYAAEEESGIISSDDDQYHEKGTLASQNGPRRGCASSSQQSKGRSKGAIKNGVSQDYYRHNVFDRNHRRQRHLKSNKKSRDHCVSSGSKGAASKSTVKSTSTKRYSASKGRDKSRSKGNGNRRSKGAMGLRTRHPTSAPAVGEGTDDTLFPLPNDTEAPTVTDVLPEETTMPTTTINPPTEAPTTLGTTAPTTTPTAPEPMERIDYVRFDVQIDEDTTNFFIVEVHPEWAPIGARRFLDLVKLEDPAPYFNEQRFFRVVDDFIVQWGVSGDPEVAQDWARATVVDDAVVESNVAGTLTFAQGSEPNSRSTQVFINYVDNSFLDESGFAPFGRLYSERDMEVAMRLYSGYGDGPPDGDGPDQLRLQEEGNDYLAADFPLLSYIISAERLEGPPPTTARSSQTDRRNFRPSGGFFTRTVSSSSTWAAASATTMILSAIFLFLAMKFRRNTVPESNGLLKGPSF